MWGRDAVAVLNKEKSCEIKAADEIHSVEESRDGKKTCHNQLETQTFGLLTRTQTASLPWSHTPRIRV